MSRTAIFVFLAVMIVAGIAYLAPLATFYGFQSDLRGELRGIVKLVDGTIHARETIIKRMEEAGVDFDPEAIEMTCSGVVGRIEVSMPFSFKLPPFHSGTFVFSGDGRCDAATLARSKGLAPPPGKERVAEAPTDVERVNLPAFAGNELAGGTHASGDRSFDVSKEDEQLPPTAPVVKLIDAGAAPQAVLRYLVLAGDKAAVSMTRSNLVSIQRKHGSTEVLKARLGNLTVVKQVAGTTPGGEVSIEASIIAAYFDKASGRAPTSDQEDALRRIIGLGARAKTTRRGVEKSRSVSIPDEVAGAVWADALVALHVALPKEPIGLGARWTVTSGDEDESAAFVTTTEMTLTGRTPTSARVTLSMRAKAKAKGNIDLGWLDGFSATKMIGTGSVELDVTSPAVREANLELKIEAASDDGDVARITSTIERRRL